MGKNKNKTKNELVFDNKQREEFLKGFSKRKKQRQRKAQKEIDIKFKEERKRIKDEVIFDFFLDFSLLINYTLNL